MTAVWKYQQFETTKLRIVSELEDIERDHGRDERIIFSLERVSELENAPPEGQLDRLIYIFSTLSQHVQFDVISYDEAKSLFDLAYTLLLVHRVPTEKGKLSILYGDLHTLKSLFAQKEGNFWKAAWQQSLSQLQSPKAKSGGDIYQKYLYGLKAIRLGNTELALSYLDQNIEPSHKMYGYFIVNRIRALRFSGDQEASRLLIEKHQDSPDLSDNFKIEITWESACLKTSTDGDIAPLTELVQIGTDHYQASYLLEHYLWAFSLQGYKSMISLPKARTLARKKELKLRASGHLYKIVSLLETAYDDTIPLLTRLQKLEDIFDRVRQLRNVDKEALVWLALSRWLHRHKQEDMLCMTLQEYAALCLRLSNGSKHDIFGLATDLFKKYRISNSKLIIP